jgi:hypothetical protein
MPRSRSIHTVTAHQMGLCSQGGPNLTGSDTANAPAPPSPPHRFPSEATSRLGVPCFRARRPLTPASTAARETRVGPRTRAETMQALLLLRSLPGPVLSGTGGGGGGRPLHSLCSGSLIGEGTRASRRSLTSSVLTWARMETTPSGRGRAGNAPSREKRRSGEKRRCWRGGDERKGRARPDARGQRERGGGRSRWPPRGTGWVTCSCRVIA